MNDWSRYDVSRADFSALIQEALKCATSILSNAQNRNRGSE